MVQGEDLASLRYLNALVPHIHYVLHPDLPPQRASLHFHHVSEVIRQSSIRCAMRSDRAGGQGLTCVGGAGGEGATHQ